MLKRSFKLCGADSLARTVQYRPLLNSMRLTDRTLFWWDKWIRPFFSWHFYAFHNIWNHIPCPFYFHRISHTHIFSSNFFHIVQTGSADRHAAYVHRIKHGNGRERTRPPDRHRNGPYFGQFLSSRKFKGNSPPRTA